MKWKEIFGILLLAVIFGFIIGWMSQFFSEIFFKQNSSLINEGFGAFSGAFFAFIFLRLASFLTNVYKRQNKHYNSMVGLEREMDELGGIIHDNIYVMNNILTANGAGGVHWYLLKALPINKKHYLDLLDINLMNELFEINYSIRKVNDDFENLNRGYNDLRGLYMQKTVTQDDFLANLKAISEGIIQLQKFITDLREDIVKFLAKIKIKLKYEKSLGAIWTNRIIKLKKISNLELDAELFEIRKAIEVNMQKDKAKLEKLNL